MSLTNPEAEAALVYSLVLDPTQILDITLDEADFTAEVYAKAYRVIKELVDSNRPVDILTLRKEGVVLDRMEMAGLHAPATEYASMINEAAYRRKIVSAAEDIALAAEVGDESALVQRMEDALVVARERKSSGSALGLEDLAAFRTVPPAPYLGILAPEGSTILYGEGGDGKGWIAAALARGLLQHGIKPAILDFENHPGEWAYRLDRLGVPLDQVSYFQPPAPMGKWADPKVNSLLNEKGVGYLIIDSAMYASNSDDPYSPQGVMQYKQARLRLENRPALLLAHTAKGQTSIYGSAFWRNEARITWYLSRDYVTNKRSMMCKKTNAYPKLEGKQLFVDFDEAMGTLNFHEAGKPYTSYIKAPDPQEEFSW